MFDLEFYKTGDIVFVKTLDFIIKNHFGILVSNTGFGSSYWVKLLINESNKERFLEELHQTKLNELSHFDINTLDKKSNLYKMLKLESTKYKLMES